MRDSKGPKPGEEALSSLVLNFKFISYVSLSISIGPLCCKLEIDQIFKLGIVGINPHLAALPILKRGINSNKYAYGSLLNYCASEFPPKSMAKLWRC
jgi:hypothetical protein